MRSTSRRGFSGRSIFSIVLAALLTVLLWAGFFSATPAEAQARGASWVGESLLHDGRQYYVYPPAEANESHGLVEGTIYYVSIEQVEGQANARKAHLIYFAPGTDPPIEQSATYQNFDLSQNDEYSNPSNPITLTLTTQAESGGISSCSVDGIGWFVCPITVFLADAMDWVFQMIATFVAVQPLLVNDTNGSLYVAWDVMRSFANIAFIIAFLIIIYSQLTGWGVTNYGLKKLIPRLIVAAILVNVSFYLSAIAVDISNVAGYGLQNILIEIRQDTFNINNDTFSDQTSQTQWANVTAAVLSGGAITAGVVGISGGTAGAIASAVYLLVPLLAGLLLTLLFVLLILAARQAIIIILIVIAPLAFVANLLPNTEKWFNKWRDLFMTMLVFFPAFSLVFGGSQLAGGIIVQNSGGSIIMMIFGMAVQVAPLVITPLLLKLSGGLLGRIAGVMNNPRKGALDRTKNWANDRAKMHRAQSLTRPGGANPFRRIAKRMERGNRLVKRSTEAHEKSFDADVMNQDFSKYARLHNIEENAKTRLGTTENRMKQGYQSKVNTLGSIEHLDNLRLEASNVRLNEETERTKAIAEEYRSGRAKTDGSVELKSLMNEMTNSLTRTAAESQRGERAQFMQKKNIAEAFTAENASARALLKVAKGVDPNGLTRAQASAEAALSKLEQEALDSSVQLLNYKAIKSGTTLKSYSAKIFAEAAEGRSTESAAVIEAAAEAVAKEGNISLLRKGRQSGTIDQQMMTQLFARHSGAMKAKGGFDLQADPSLAGASPERMFASVAATMGDITGDKLPDIKAGFWEDVSFDIDKIKRTISDPTLDPKVRTSAQTGLRNTYRNLTAALKDDDTRIKIGDRLVETSRIHSELHKLFNVSENEIDYASFDVTDADIKRKRP
jgi:hypothetical protein